ncbi:MAG: hypothetical protein A3F83_08610 [Candidatus Glassbacteria bacterium RIFCSPLOWO2_12_FULL_58_11]|uniref:DUF4321 domain-containing protein n=2 Tax=Candidatus Glassiibacteriota TaxID=1817805 RepID=A0A1F5YP06_9BACT|nr:MAG: hypothetical protein A2Z86_11580 [Candidatus Glassbacteria bacterium GWA2_58_10]OGG01958.1 MAG: hypothetical protein A3F83_08610 [Candidatus Glassbacteria bacterium RIFCSPLOWO2_12_FULL_58_11]
MHRKRLSVYVIILIIGMLIGGYMGEILATVMPDGVAKDFFLTSIVGNFGPVSINLLIIALTLGPLVLKINLVAILGLFIAVYLFRSFI